MNKEGKITAIVTLIENKDQFINEGYVIPQYMIEVKGKTVFEWSMETLKEYREQIGKYLFVFQKNSEMKRFIEEKCKKINLEQANIIEIDCSSLSQVELAMYAIEQCSLDEPILIYNCDTYLENQGMSCKIRSDEGYLTCLEVSEEEREKYIFNDDGNLVQINEVNENTDNRVKGVCYFSTAGLYRELYREYYGKNEQNKSEKNIIELYKCMLHKGMTVGGELAEKSKIHCLQTPEDLLTFEKSEYDAWGGNICKTDKIVIWGIGDSFHKFYSLCSEDIKKRIVFLVDKNASGDKQLCGLDVKKPDALYDINTKFDLIITSGSVNEIQAELDSMTKLDVNVIYGFDYINSGIIAKELAKAKIRTKKSNEAIILQGNITSAKEVLMILKYYSVIFPDKYLIVSTWSTVEQAIIQEIEPWADKVLISDYPEFVGYAHVNYQIKGMRVAVEYAYEIGIKYLLTTKINAIVYKSDIFEKYKEEIENWDNTVCRKYGLNSRILVERGDGDGDISNENSVILVPPFSVSDLIQLGEIHDMVNFWSIDLQSETYLPQSWYQNELEALMKYSQKDGAFFCRAENYITAMFCKKISYDVVPSYDSAFKFYKEFFIFVKKNMLNLKYKSTRNAFLSDSNLDIDRSHMRKLRGDFAPDCFQSSLDRQHMTYDILHKGKTTFYTKYGQEAVDLALEKYKPNME